MPIFLLNERLAFPDPAQADPSGILAVGGDLSPARLLLAYSLGIFPWYDETQSPILWHAPPERMVLLPDEVHVSRTMQKVFRRGHFQIRYDTAFRQVIEACASTPRPDQDGTWLNAEMMDAYCELHARGFAHSAETWCDGRLVGGLYGVVMGTAFFGESMFSHADNASKAAFIASVRALGGLGYTLIDCQVYTEHLDSLGARAWPRRTFTAALAKAIQGRPTRLWPQTPPPPLPRTRSRPG